jgi:hypothetical protein
MATPPSQNISQMMAAFLRFRQCGVCEPPHSRADILRKDTAARLTIRVGARACFRKFRRKGSAAISQIHVRLNFQTATTLAVIASEAKQSSFGAANKKSWIASSLRSSQ